MRVSYLFGICIQLAYGCVCMYANHLKGGHHWISTSVDEGEMTNELNIFS